MSIFYNFLNISHWSNIRELLVQHRKLFFWTNIKKVFLVTMKLFHGSTIVKYTVWSRIKCWFRRYFKLIQMIRFQHDLHGWSEFIWIDKETYFIILVQNKFFYAGPEESILSWPNRQHSCWFKKKSFFMLVKLKVEVALGWPAIPSRRNRRPRSKLRCWSRPKSAKNQKN